ncbi:MAG: winged helix-turn-helix transcriptional regulator [bacterium]|nr:winged helix-turn-helix transcriptional regulator [bacterium]
MKKQKNDTLQTKFAISLHPEIFFALQVLSSDKSENFQNWKNKTLEIFPRQTWPLDIPSGMWPAIADVLDIAPTSDLETVVQTLESMSERLIQERLLLGLLHKEEAVLALLDQTKPVAEVINGLPKAKREWLAFIGLFPFEATGKASKALNRVIDTPQSFKNDLVATLKQFWKLSFAETWQELQPGFDISIIKKMKLLTESGLKTFLRHSLLPIEINDKKQELRALRGGYILPMEKIDECICSPSVFNLDRLWTVRQTENGSVPWFPYVENPPTHHRSGLNQNTTAITPDVALVFRALGDTTRFAIVSLIGRLPRTSVELTEILGVAKPTISHHIHILRSADLLIETDYGKSVLLTLNKQLIDSLGDLASARIFESNQPLDLPKTRRKNNAKPAKK